jgi:hypothetical protein
MNKRAGYILGLPFLIGSAAFASSPLSSDTSSWPWIAVAGLFVTLGAIALVSRRRMPFGKSG